MAKSGLFAISMYSNVQTVKAPLLGLGGVLRKHFTTCFVFGEGGSYSPKIKNI